MVPPQKRVYLISEIARQMHARNMPVHFSFVGDVENIIPLDKMQFCTFYGNIKEENKLHEIYLNSDVLLLTSLYEGLPLAIMEMMARGKVVISTAVDGIPDYITHKENGLLITETEESKIIESGINLLELLIYSQELKSNIGKKSFSFAMKHFSGKTFCNIYRTILIDDKFR